MLCLFCIIFFSVFYIFWLIIILCRCYTTVVTNRTHKIIQTWRKR
ncbi:hypothetical protein DORFOR_03287 [Dorea formicigenerans ATCC 27755]|uniref:Uncharacterized protein n=1 Tax=Dorea formicigenerans ATCC 27755 TaxID=411461 RepID=B0GAH1_9FIRM|nr:hypothetical protein DORFOR_03287 [Dorea formicigenerans ATCC 27755]